jgi:bifunctional non-homologous end joining protein LigD
MSERFFEGVRLSNPDKILYPEQGITKGDLADHYATVADVMLPHIAFRPITMVRCPTGRQKNCFYQRHAGSGVPKQIEKVLVPGFDNPYLYVRDLAGLIALVQIGVLEIHPWAITKKNLERPDRLIFDLDPAEGLDFQAVVAASLEVRDRLKDLKLVSFVKTTGGKGLHVVVPIRPCHDWKEAKAWTKAFSEQMAVDSPDRYLTKISKAERAGRIFIDYLRNDPTSTAVGPYSTRSRVGAPVATPLEWGEVNAKLDPAAFNVRTIPDRVSTLQSDPWAEMLDLRQQLPALATS